MSATLLFQKLLGPRLGDMLPHSHLQASFMLAAHKCICISQEVEVVSHLAGQCGLAPSLRPGPGRCSVNPRETWVPAGLGGAPCVLAPVCGRSARLHFRPQQGSPAHCSRPASPQGPAVRLHLHSATHSGIPLTPCLPSLLLHAPRTRPWQPASPTHGPWACALHPVTEACHAPCSHPPSATEVLPTHVQWGWRGPRNIPDPPG